MKICSLLLQDLSEGSTPVVVGFNEIILPYHHNRMYNLCIPIQWKYTISNQRRRRAEIKLCCIYYLSYIFQFWKVLEVSQSFSENILHSFCPGDQVAMEMVDFMKLKLVAILTKLKSLHPKNRISPYNEISDDGVNSLWRCNKNSDGTQDAL